MEELGFDSLMYTELGVALEAAGVAVPDAGNADLTGIATVDDCRALVRQWGDGEEEAVSAPVVSRQLTDGGRDQGAAGRWPASAGSCWAGDRRALYERVLDTERDRARARPGDSGFLVAANHASHLDIGLVKHALGDWGRRLVALAAKDYFFEDPVSAPTSRTSPTSCRWIATARCASRCGWRPR